MVNDDKITCEICNKLFRRITRTHLKQHDITTDQYKVLYPTSPIICNSLLNETSKYFKENNPMHNPVYKEKVVYMRKGKAKSADHKRKLSDAQLGEKHHYWGKKRPEHSAHMKKIMPAIMKNLYSDGRPGNNKGKKLNLSDEQRKAMSERSKGKVKWPNGNPNKGKKLNLSTEQRANRSLKAALAIKNRKDKRSDTDIELKFKEFCDLNNIKYIHQFVLTCKNTTWIYDFYLPGTNMLVEIDGEFFHSLKKQINRDIIKTENAKDCNYNFCRISSINLDFSIIFNNIDIIELNNAKIIESRLAKLSI